MADENQNNLEWLTELFNSRTEVNSQWYFKNTIALDGYHFQKCRFDSCNLTYQNGDFQLSNCFISDDCTITHPAKGVKIIKLFTFKAKMTNLVSVHFKVTTNADGTISIIG